MKPGMSVSRVAREHDVNTNQVFKWCRLYERGQLGAGSKSAQLLPVRIEHPVAAAGSIVVQQPEVEVSHPRGARTGSIEIELQGGRITVRGAVDRAALRLAIKMLSR